MRGYPHFDKPLSFKKAQPLITSTEWVAHHSFFPFISFSVVTKKVKKDSLTGKAIFKPPKERQILYASHIDSLIYGYYATILSERYNAALVKHDLESEVIAFRSIFKKSNVDFANDAFEEIKSRGSCSAVALDITGFFDNIDHALLKSSWMNIIQEKNLPNDHYAVYKSITRYSHVLRDSAMAELAIPANAKIANWDGLCNAETFREKIRSNGLIKTNNTKKGIPQGSPISALLSNIYMLSFDLEIKAKVDAIGGKYYRYCDDILIIIDSEHVNSIASYVSDLTSKHKLEINISKTETTTFLEVIPGEIKILQQKPMQYLGFTFDGTRKLIRSAAFANYSHKMKRGVSLAKQTARKHNKIRRKKGQKSQPIYKKSLYEMYSHLGQRNFITYGHRAANIMGSDAIKKQLKPLWDRLAEEIEAAESDAL